ncbi:hypothetical protein [Salinibacillus xinjiangensis]|uniref:Uncharacterized protein n=1 Tax=Salinibacillus xinjiangensis TaxID=1229268 RepID=A0A6G1X418_9BACI|nr:hypothetical protein [Salinibacillus xinjiangensis]MRG85646.1 hypothetical protein [Salinibacillus xinjiangensis]
MNSFFENIVKWAKSKTGELGENVKNTLQNMNVGNSISIQDLASIILLHPNTQVEQTEYLRLLFNDCYLKLEDVEVFLETKGQKHQQILSLKIIKQGETLTSYKSYEAKNDKVKVPNSVDLSFG